MTRECTGANARRRGRLLPWSTDDRRTMSTEAIAATALTAENRSVDALRT
jgi:hypothetical protein